MKCFMCKGNLEDKNTTFMVELNNCIISIKNVPSQVCNQCGEVTYNNEVAKQLEKEIDESEEEIESGNVFKAKDVFEELKKEYKY